MPPLVAGATTFLHGSPGDTMGAGHFGQLVLMAVTEENHTTGLAPVEMHPFWCLRHHLPPEGGTFSGAMQ